jgi:chromosome segregation ATPase
MAKRFEGTLAGPDASSVTLAKRFEGTLAGPDASSATVELTARYTQLAEKAAVLQQQNQTLSEENDRFKKQVDALEAQLKQTQTELTEANTLLVDMLGELNNWKSDILGFRNEMRLAAKAQLEALLKILEVLGAEAGPLAPVVEPNQPKPNKAGPSDPSK